MTLLTNYPTLAEAATAMRRYSNSHQNNVILLLRNNTKQCYILRDVSLSYDDTPAPLDNDTFIVLAAIDNMLSELVIGLSLGNDHEH